MKYYIKMTNTKTGKSMIMTFPVFTSKKRAESYARDFEKVMKKDDVMSLAKVEVVK